jgi:hypothetical protein
MTEIERGAISSEERPIAPDGSAFDGARGAAQATDKDRLEADQPGHLATRDDHEFVTEWDPRLS